LLPLLLLLLLLLYICVSNPQLWNLPWWHCSSGSCVDQGINEVEYMEKVITTIKSKFNLDTNKVSARLTESKTCIWINT
jgi:hypothetical protein